MMKANRLMSLILCGMLAVPPLSVSAAGSEEIFICTPAFTYRSEHITIEGTKANFLVTGVEKSGDWTACTVVGLNSRTAERGTLHVAETGDTVEVGDLLYLKDYNCIETDPVQYEGQITRNYGKADRLLGSAFRWVIRHEQVTSDHSGQPVYLQTVAQSSLDKNDLRAVKQSYEVWGDVLYQEVYRYEPYLGIVGDALTEEQINAIPGHTAHRTVAVDHQDTDTARFADLPDGTQVLEVQVGEPGDLAKAVASLPEDVTVYLVEENSAAAVTWHTGEICLEIADPDWMPAEGIEGLQEPDVREENGKWLCYAKIDPDVAAFSGKPEDSGDDAAKAIIFGEKLLQEQSGLVTHYTLPGSMDFQEKRSYYLQEVIRDPEKNWDYYWNLDNYSVYKEFTETHGSRFDDSDIAAPTLPQEKDLPFYDSMRYHVTHDTEADGLVYWADQKLEDSDALQMAETPSYFGFPDAWHLDRIEVLEEQEYPDGSGYQTSRDLGCHVVRPSGAASCGSIAFRFGDLAQIGVQEIPVIQSAVDLYRIQLTIEHSEFAQDHVRRDPENGRYRVDFEPPSGSAYVMTGDPNQDGVLNASDAALILTKAAKIGAGQDATMLQEGDVNRDGAVNASDAAVLLAYSAARNAGNRYSKLRDFIPQA